MVYATKLGSPVNNANLRAFGDFVNNLWQFFLMYSRGFQRIDIVFDNYSSDSARSWERKRQAAGVAAAATKISHIDQPLPPGSELPKFWASTDNKVALQQFFIDWIQEKYDCDQPLFLGGCHKNDQRNKYYKVSSTGTTEVRLLYIYIYFYLHTYKKFT